MSAIVAGPLKGLRVLDCGTAIVGPWSATLLSFLGADAIKVERPSGEITRLARPHQNGWSTAYTVANLCKQSIELDFKDPKSKPAIERLLSQADVVIENYRPGVADRIGIGFQQASVINPHIVYGSSSGWGDVGPMRDMSAVDSHLQAFSGFASLNGAVGGAPEMLRYTHIDPSGGTFLAAGVLLGVINRQRFGTGSHVVTSHLAMTLAMQASRIAETLATNKPIPRSGSACTASAPNQCFKTRDGKYIAITVQTADQWTAFCRALRKPELEQDQRFSSNTRRVENREALATIISDEVSALPARWWIIQFENVDVPNCTVLDAEDVLVHAHILENEYLVTVEPDHTGPMLSGGLPWSFSKTHASMARPTPEPGADTTSALEHGFGEEREANSSNKAATDACLPLDGLKVVDLTQGYAGPSIGLLLAEVGAAVTKIEPKAGDWSRDLAPHSADSASEVFIALNRNKTTQSLDPDQADDARVIKSLIADADILLIDWEENQNSALSHLIKSSQHERLITLNLSYFGEKGPLAGRAGSELIIQAMTGYVKALGAPEHEPIRVGADIAESAATGMGLLGVLAALYHRYVSGEGQTVSVSRLGAMMSLRSLHWAAISNPDAWLGPSYCLAETDPPRHGYRTQDSNVFVSMMNLREEAGFTAMLGELDMSADVAGNERFLKEGRTTIGMGFLSGDYHDLWETYLVRRPSTEVLDIFNRNGATAVAFPELDQLMEHPQVNALGLIDQCEGRRYLRAPWRGPWTPPVLVPVQIQNDKPQRRTKKTAKAAQG
ncbi:MAG: CoA transferase [Rhodospirillaceae bacterium]|nr:CoA transferase [Rhodospirillaceae bacterium]